MALIGGTFSPAYANEIPSAVPDDSTDGFTNGSIVVAPIPFSNPLLETGLAIGGAYLYKNDEASDTSNIGLGGFGSSNGSKAFGASFSNVWDSNRWKLSATVAAAELYYDVYTSLGTIPIKQSGNFARFELRYGFADIYSVTGIASYLDTQVGLDSDKADLLPGIIFDTEMAFGNIGLQLERDSTDDDMYPTKGSKISFEASLGKELTDSLRSEFSKGNVFATGYRQLAQKTVVAGKLYHCFAEKGTPFFELCSLGAGDGFRGFSPTQFLGPSSTSAQVEIRQRLTDRFGVVAFAGVGTGETSYDGDIGTRYAGGVGARFRLSRKFPLDFSVDAALNDIDEQTLYVYVGQRF